MTDYLIGLAFTLACCVAFAVYWVRRFDRESLVRMARRDSETAAEAERFESEKRAWDESQARAWAEYQTRVAAVEREFRPTEPALTITVTLNSATPTEGAVEVARIRIPIAATQADAQVNRAIAALDAVGRQLAFGG
jgi:hypothetical protein